MARMLYPRDSVSFMLDAVRRHQRLCRKSQTADVLAKNIQQPVDNLKNKYSQQELAKTSRQDAYDDVLFLDIDLDNVIRDVFEACKSFDRNNPGGNVLNRVFESGNFSHIVRMPYADEPVAAEKLAVKIENLGNSHNLFPLAERIRNAAQNVIKALEALNEAIRKEKASEAETEIAKLDLIRAYEINYLDARKQFGSNNADRLFPTLPSRVKEESDEESPAQSGSKAA